MKTALIPLGALLALNLAFADDAALSAPASDDMDAAPAPASPPVGRYQVTEAGGYQVMVDTATGRVWRFSPRGRETLMTPVLYEHAEGEETALPDYEPEPTPRMKPRPPVSPEVASERLAAAKEFVNDTINEPIMTYASSLGEFPPNLASLQTNVRRDPRWSGPYLKQTIIDPWGNYYRYAYPGTHNKDTYDVWSLGPDGVESADDIGNW